MALTADAINVDPGRWHEAEGRWIVHHTDAQIFEYDLRALSELVLQFHRLHLVASDADIDMGILYIPGMRQ